MLTRTTIILALLAVIVALPFALRPRHQVALSADDTLVVITPGNDAIRHEVGLAFARWYQARTGRTVAIDWRLIGGTSEIARYIEGGYAASFQNYWVNTLHRPWSNAVLNAFAGGKLAADAPAEAREARAAFLASDVGCGLDVFFGGGPFDFDLQAKAGRIVDSGILKKHPEWFKDDVIPRTFAGQPYWDAQGRWFGVVLSSFGIVSNRDAVARLGLKSVPSQWTDLADPRLQGQVGLADPTKSGSINAAFENLVQQQMAAALRAAERREHPTSNAERPTSKGGEAKASTLTAGSSANETELEKRAVAEGWARAMRLLQAIAGNARYFSDSAQQIPIDVAAGDCATGMCIDFYGRQQAEATLRRGGGDRLVYVTPAGGSVASVDPVALMRGAPHREVAAAFIEFLLSPDGQRLWDLKPGAPGGPEYFALRRLPVRRDFYGIPGIAALRSDPEELPYAGGDRLVYRAAWTSPLFRELAFTVRVMCLDTQPELQRAWRALIKAGMPADALAVFNDVSAVDYAAENGRIREALTSRNPVDAITLATELDRHFREQYERAEAMAERASVGKASTLPAGR